VRVCLLAPPHPLARAGGAWDARPRGVFALRPFAAGERVGEYTGHLRFKSHRDSESDYLFDCAELAGAGGRGVQVDAGPAGNETRFINAHAAGGDRGVRLAPAPNVQFVFEAGEEAAMDRFRVVVRAVCAIAPGEELLLDYGPSYHIYG
jgi:SET domain-containing protein